MYFYSGIQCHNGGGQNSTSIYSVVEHALDWAISNV